MGCLGRAKCTVHSISAQTRQEGVACIKDKGLTVLLYILCQKAAELLSSTTADTIEMLFKEDNKMLRFAAFIREVDSWFDVLNSNSLYHSHKPLNTAYRSVYIFSSYF